MLKSVFIDKIDVNLLREQRNTLVSLANRHWGETENHLEGIINLLDYILDVAEGYNV